MLLYLKRAYMHGSALGFTHVGIVCRNKTAHIEENCGVTTLTLFN